MAPSAGHWHQLLGRQVKLLKHAWQRAARTVQVQAGPSARPAHSLLEPIPLRTGAARQPLHPLAFLRQGRRWLSGRALHDGTRHFSSKAARPSRASLPRSRVGDAVRASPGRAPFASTLRPNLTGGALNRTAGGYGVGAGRAGARHFSHSPAAPAEVVQNVSQALRAFFLSGKKPHFDGTDPRTGEKRWKAVSALEDEVTRKTSALPKATPGSYVDFSVNPTITAFSPLTGVAGFPTASKDAQNTLAAEGLIDLLSADFSRAVKDMAIVLKDIERLSSLGDLTITYHTTALRVHFPGCDAETVERLCDELGVRRGIIRQDEDFDSFVGTEIALLFPFAPSEASSETSLYEPAAPVKPPYQSQQIDWQHMMSPSHSSLASEHFSVRSETGLEFDDLVDENPWRLSSPSGYSTLRSSDLDNDVYTYERLDADSPLEYQGFEGIYRFLEHYEPERARR